MNKIYTRLITGNIRCRKNISLPGLWILDFLWTLCRAKRNVFWRKPPARAALELIARSRREGLNLCCVSGYRSYARQAELYAGNPYIAAPGTSEHQSGLALDLSCPAVQMHLTEDFVRTPEGIWLDGTCSALRIYSPLSG